MRYQCDQSYERHGLVILGGSPMRILRVSLAAVEFLSALESGADLTATPAQHRLLTRLEHVGLIHPRPIFNQGDTQPRISIPVITPVHRHRSPHNGPEPQTLPDAVVVDDGSIPPIPVAAVRLSKNQGPAAARNAGLTWLMTHEPQAEYVIFLDADVDPGPDPDWYLPLLALCQRDPQLAVVAPRVISSLGQGLLAHYERSHSPLDLGAEPGRVQPGTRIGYLPAAALLCRVAPLIEVSGFDADLRYGEDVDLIWRLIDAGWTCRYQPEVVVTHPPRPTWKSWSRQRVAYGSSAAPLAIRHKARLAPARIHPFSLATWVAALTGHPILAVGTIIGSTIGLNRKVPDLPRSVAARIALTGTWRSGHGLAQAVRRAWWPILMLIAPFSRRVRRVVILSFLITGPPKRETAIKVLDDLSYSKGVWQGVRTAAGTRHFRDALFALLPQGSRSSTSDATVQA
jgi:mycofactocin system glycosyltransferase